MVDNESTCSETDQNQTHTRKWIALNTLLKTVLETSRMDKERTGIWRQGHAAYLQPLASTTQK